VLNPRRLCYIQGVCTKCQSVRVECKVYHVLNVKQFKMYLGNITRECARANGLKSNALTKMSTPYDLLYFGAF